MKLVLCSIFDSAVNTYSPPFAVRGVGLAIRDFRFEASRAGGAIAKSPSDFSLFVIGEFDDEACSFILLDAPRRMMSGAEALSAKEMLNEG